MFVKVAFVVQRCGKEVIGGAEAHCMQMAQRISKHIEVEVLTTCALDYMTWENHYQSGVEVLDGIKIRRFPVAKTRDPKSFEQRCIEYDTMFKNNRENFKAIPIEDQKSWLDAQGPISYQLLDFVKTHKDNYSVFIFFTYLYATTHMILPEVREKAILLPLAHDEWPIHLSFWDEWFKGVNSFIFNTEIERKFLAARFPSIKFEGPPIGVGIEPPPTTDPTGFRKRFRISGPFMLYVGRVDNLKGCWQLYEFYKQLKRPSDTSHKERVSFLRKIMSHKVSTRWKDWGLVYVGKVVSKYSKRRDIKMLGVCDEQTKWDAIAACDVLILPSEFESLSMVILEAWAVKKPVLVNAKCAVTVGQCHRSQGGFGYNSFEEFSILLEKVTTPEVSKMLGENGYKFVMENYAWPVIEKKFLEALEPFLTFLKK